MRPSLGLLCSAGLWGAPTRATATGPLQGPGNTPLLVYTSSVLCCPIPLFLGAPCPSSSPPWRWRNPRSSPLAGLSRQLATKSAPWEKAPCHYKQV